MLIYETRPAVFYKTLRPFRVGRFIFRSLLINDPNVFFEWVSPPRLDVRYIPFFVMGAVPNVRNQYTIFCSDCQGEKERFVNSAKNLTEFL